MLRSRLLSDTKLTDLDNMGGVMNNIVYIAVSLDGCIATPDGGVDWLHEIPNPTQSDYGWSEFMGRIAVWMKFLHLSEY